MQWKFIFPRSGWWESQEWSTDKIAELLGCRLPSPTISVHGGRVREEPLKISSTPPAFPKVFSVGYRSTYSILYTAFPCLATVNPFCSSFSFWSPHHMCSAALPLPTSLCPLLVSGLLWALQFNYTDPKIQSYCPYMKEHVASVILCLVTLL